MCFSTIRKLAILQWPGMEIDQGGVRQPMLSLALLHDLFWSVHIYGEKSSSYLQAHCRVSLHDIISYHHFKLWINNAKLHRISMMESIIYSYIESLCESCEA